VDSGYKGFANQLQIASRRPPQVKSSKAEMHAKYHKIPVIRFEDQNLTSFSDLVIFQLLFKQLHLKERLVKCFDSLKISPIFGRHLVVLLLIVHLLLGFRRLREVDYYRDDPLVLRLMGLRKLPDVSTISRALCQMEAEGIEKVRDLSTSIVLEGLKREALYRLTFDFDGLYNPPRDIEKGRQWVTIKRKRERGATIPFSALYPRLVNSLIFFTVLVTSMIPMEPMHS
jgi:hypothetical protein